MLCFTNKPPKFIFRVQNLIDHQVNTLTLFCSNSLLNFMFINEFRVKLCETGTPYHLYERADQNGPARFCQIETAACHRTCQPVDQNQFSVRHNRRATFADWLIWPDNLWQVAWVNTFARLSGLVLIGLILFVFLGIKVCLMALLNKIMKDVGLKLAVT